MYRKRELKISEKIISKKGNEFLTNQVSSTHSHDGVFYIIIRKKRDLEVVKHTLTLTITRKKKEIKSDVFIVTL